MGVTYSLVVNVKEEASTVYVIQANKVVWTYQTDEEVLKVDEGQGAVCILTWQRLLCARNTTWQHRTLSEGFDFTEPPIAINVLPTPLLTVKILTLHTQTVVTEDGGRYTQNAPQDFLRGCVSCQSFFNCLQHYSEAELTPAVPGEVVAVAYDCQTVLRYDDSKKEALFLPRGGMALDGSKDITPLLDGKYAIMMSDGYMVVETNPRAVNVGRLAGYVRPKAVYTSICGVPGDPQHVLLGNNGSVVYAKVLEPGHEAPPHTALTVLQTSSRQLFMTWVLALATTLSTNVAPPQIIAHAVIFTSLENFFSTDRYYFNAETVVDPTASGLLYGCFVYAAWGILLFAVYVVRQICVPVDDEHLDSKTVSLLGTHQSQAASPCWAPLACYAWFLFAVPLIVYTGVKVTPAVVPLLVIGLFAVHHNGPVYVTPKTAEYLTPTNYTADISSPVKRYFFGSSTWIDREVAVPPHTSLFNSYSRQGVDLLFERHYYFVEHVPMWEVCILLGLFGLARPVTVALAVGYSVLGWVAFVKHPFIAEFMNHLMGCYYILIAGAFAWFSYDPYAFVVPSVLLAVSTLLLFTRGIYELVRGVAISGFGFSLHTALSESYHYSDDPLESWRNSIHLSEELEKMDPISLISPSADTADLLV
eukprot:TRINITY_DN18985_c0_g1_i1.p1 TRINITY_DN18985_c0_g1~~TRINITY_DN18985_c0_g1_i1.p1  ORF type:complete len:698 (+),score=173.38 TRINITY_DN18985_c0_g1_i1:162-2096(+)